MAVAQAQHALREMVDALKKMELVFAIHPVAGRTRLDYECIIS